MATNDQPLNFPVSRELKARIAAYMRDKGLSQAAACRVLLDSALAANGYPPTRKNPI